MEEIFAHALFRKNIIPIFSLAIGTILLLVLAFTKIEILFPGFIYVILAIVVNIIYLIYLLITYYNKKIDAKECISRIGITCINIPITILYIFIVFEVIL